MDMQLENMLFNYHESLPEPKINYVMWWYGEGGVKDFLQTHHIKPFIRNKEATNGTRDNQKSDRNHQNV